MTRTKRRLEVVELATNKVVRVLDVSKLSERQREKCLRGLLTQMDRERFFVREVESEHPTRGTESPDRDDLDLELGDPDL